MDIIERARAYLQAMPPAISGQGGHNATFTAASALVHGFQLDPSRALSLLSEYNVRCIPPWSEKDLRHKIDSALSTPHDKPAGHLLANGNGRPAAKTGGPTLNGTRYKPNAPIMPGPAPQAAPVPVRNGAPPKIDCPINIPDPMSDGMRQLLLAAFEPGECVRIVPARLNDERREVPDGVGTTISREEWLAKIETAKGDPNNIWRSSDRTGIYIAVNPLKAGGSSDNDVTAYRHVLVEFDKLSDAEQWNLYVQTKLPCTAVISSGGKSVHAWVRVDARDRAEYDARVKSVYAVLEAYGLDQANRNPGRLSRLPGCVRFNRRQELLALGIGSETFTDWLIERELGSYGQQITIGELLDFPTDEDPDNIIGSRWICRGGSCLIVAQAGVGKSTLSMQASILWGLGRSLWGIQPVKPLRSLIIQHENDKGDLSEMLKGVILGAGIARTAEHGAMLGQNVRIVRERTHTGAAFLKILHRLVDRHRPDLVWIDPLYSYIGGDISDQKTCSEFLCHGLGPITEATGVSWMCMHHTGKPSTDPRARRGWTSTDYSYAGLGSSILTNWFRATITLLKREENLYELQLGKRGRRAQARDLHHNIVSSVWLQHSSVGLCWQQTEQPEEYREGPGATKNGKGGVYKFGRPAAQFPLEQFLTAVAGRTLKHQEILCEIQTIGKCSERSARRILLELKPHLEHNEKENTYIAVEPAA